MTYSPLSADVEGKKWLIAGGGGVSLCKVRDLLPHGAIIWIVSTGLFAGLSELDADPVYKGRLILSRRTLEDGDLLDADFVIATTGDRALNSHISAVCHRQGTPANVVDVKKGYSFISPSIVRDGPAVMGISIRGVNSVIARYLRVRVSRILPDNPGDLTQQLGGYGGRIKTLLPHPLEVRSGPFYELAEKGPENGCGLIPKRAEIIINRKPE